MTRSDYVQAERNARKEAEKIARMIAEYNAGAVEAAQGGQRDSTG